jgi:hypothetical protein
LIGTGTIVSVRLYWANYFRPLRMKRAAQWANFVNFADVNWWTGLG